MNLLNQLINDLGGMVQASSTKQVLLQVFLKRETNNQLKTETENTFEDFNLENLISFPSFLVSCILYQLHANLF